LIGATLCDNWRKVKYAFLRQIKRVKEEGSYPRGLQLGVLAKRID